MAKKSKKPRKSKSAEVSPSATKARLLEQLVADLYKLDDVTVETNVFMPVPDNPKRKREIDVLVTGHFAGLAMRLPIECKNYKRRIQAPDIDAFVGKLHDLRLPLQGVYVSTIGFSSGALGCAEKANVKTLLLSGLVGGRLASAVIDAVQSVVYLRPQISQISVQNDVKVVKNWGYLHTFFDTGGTIVGSTPDIVWTDWVKGPDTRDVRNLQLRPHHPRGLVPTVGRRDLRPAEDHHRRRGRCARGRPSRYGYAARAPRRP